MPSTDGIVETGRTLIATAREEELTRMAAGLAYHAFNSLIPALLLVLAAVAYFGALSDISRGIAASMGIRHVAISGQLQQLSSHTSGRLRAVVIAGLIFLWSSGRLFESLRSAFEDVYGVGEPKRRFEYQLDVLLAFATVAGALVVVTALGFVLTNVLSGVVRWVVTPLLLVVVLFVVFLPMYYLFPHPSVGFREAIPGAAFAAVAWALSGIGFRLYAAVSQSVQLYGVAGGLLLFLTWLYVGGFILLLGVTLNGVVADRIDPA